MDYSVVVPTYNERENVEELVERISSSLENMDYEIIIVDDDSPDKTWELAGKLAESRNDLRVIRRRKEKGLATAVVRGFEEAKGERLAVIDSDLQHPPEKLRELYEALDDNDIAIGSRKVEGGGIEDWPFYRKIISKGAELIGKVFVKEVREVKDPLSGFFALRREVIEDVELDPEGYKILIEILVRGEYNDVEEMPFTFVDREKGESSLGLKQNWNYLKHIFRLSKDTGEMFRFFKFCLVGLSGVFVNMGVLYVLTELAGLFYLISGFFAVESAIVSNFVLNELWTFNDRTGKTILHRFGKFNLISFGGLAINMAFLYGLTEFVGLYYLLSNLIGIAAATAWNFSLNTLFTWHEDK
ncbi:MAG: glycosyltransferase [Candidatus Aenigmatarchaeota archaeon]